MLIQRPYDAQYVEGPERMEKVSMKRIGSDWKFGGFIRNPTK